MRDEVDEEEEEDMMVSIGAFQAPASPPMTSDLGEGDVSDMVVTPQMSLLHTPPPAPAPSDLIGESAREEAAQLALLTSTLQTRRSRLGMTRTTPTMTIQEGLMRVPTEPSQADEGDDEATDATWADASSTAGA